MVEIGAAHQNPRGKDLMEEQKVMSQHSQANSRKLAKGQSQNEVSGYQKLQNSNRVVGDSQNSRNRDSQKNSLMGRESSKNAL